MENNWNIIGAGLCGSLLAIRLAQLGKDVHLYEKREDLRKVTLDAGRSINLALSSRGLAALDLVGAREQALELCIPMHGRMIHIPGHEPRLSKYSGRAGDYINSISRPGLNGLLLDIAEGFPNLNLHFKTQCTSVDVFTGSCVFSQDGTEIKGKSGRLIGTDGAGSAVRKGLMANTTKLLFGYSQSFLTHGYKELRISPNADGTHKIYKNALHIWPKGKHMIIALPNLDGSFTVTMFHPYEGAVGFNTIKTEQDVLTMFEREYPQLLELIPDIVQEYFANPVGTLGTIKCNPWQANNQTLIMGDAAHAIVPFYGQGMNASFEDVKVFSQMVDNYGLDNEALFDHFQQERIKDADAIADLAVDNFYEMQDKVADPVFIKKRTLEMKLEQMFEEYYSKYSLVTFRPEMRYSDAMRLGRAQDELLLSICESREVDDIDLNKVMNQLKSLV